MVTEENPEKNDVHALLDAYTVPAAPALYAQEAEHCVRCAACAHRCHIRPGHRGICRMRHNREGVLYAPSDYVAGLQVDPIEKKPFYHVLPGGRALSFGMLGCNFHCRFCQNWLSSQTLRDLNALAGFEPCRADTIIERALDTDADAVISTYNEPLITAEWSERIFEKAKVHGLLCGFVSNGYATREVLEFLRPVMDLYKVDLKCFSEEGYQSLGGGLKPVLESIERSVQLGFWVEVVTLVVPGFNDAPDELRQTAAFIAGLSRDIPWHVTAFFPTYKAQEYVPTTGAHLERAWDAGKEAGLRYVYAGNMAGRMGDRENTLCPACGCVVIRRRGFQVLQNLLEKGCCPQCHSPVAGRWTRTTAPL